MLTELAIFACLVGEATRCKEEVIPLPEDTPLMGCVTGSPVSVANWAKENPKWQVKKWQCRPHRPTQDI